MLTVDSSKHVYAHSKNIRQQAGSVKAVDVLRQLMLIRVEGHTSSIRPSRRAHWVRAILRSTRVHGPVPILPSASVGFTAGVVIVVHKRPGELY